MRMFFLVAIVLGALVLPSHVDAQGVGLMIQTPTQGETIYGNTISVRVDTSELTVTPRPLNAVPGQYPNVNRVGQGHMLIMLDLQPVVEWDRRDPYPLLNIPAGDHLLTVELVQNDGSSFTPPIIEQVVFTATSVEVPALVLPERLSAVAGESSDTEVPPYTVVVLCALYSLSCGQLR